MGKNRQGSPKVSKHIGLRLKELRRAIFKKKSCQGEMAELLETTQSELSLWENGERTPTTARLVDVVEKLESKGIRCSLDWILRGIGNPPEVPADWNAQESNDDLSERIAKVVKEAETQPISKMDAEGNIWIRIPPKTKKTIREIYDFFKENEEESET